MLCLNAMINEVYICFENKLSSKLAPLTESDKKIVNSSSDSVDKYIFYQIAKQKLL